jgi:hypothetical protein
MLNGAPDGVEEGPENGVTLWGLGSRWNAERDQAADFFSSKKGTERDPLLIRWDL